jgi:hypothetical protein
MCDHDIDTDLISCHMCVYVCGAELVSSVVLDWEESERMLVKAYVWVCIYKESDRG